MEESIQGQSLKWNIAQQIKWAGDGYRRAIRKLKLPVQYSEIQPQSDEQKNSGTVLLMDEVKCCLEMNL